MIFSFVFKYITNSDNLQLDDLMLLLNREGSFRTEGSPMESCRPAIIVSFGVTAHWCPQGCQRSRNRFHGRVSCLMQFGHPRFETLRSVPLKKGDWAMTILIFLTIPLRRKCVQLRMCYELASFGKMVLPY